MPDSFDIDGPGTSSYAPAHSAQDGIILYRTRSYHAADATDMPGSAAVPDASSLAPPSPSTGGAMGQFGRLGWSNGFGAFKRRTSFTGRVINVRTLPLNTGGHVGYSTRSSRLRAKVQALYDDATPSSQAVAREVTGT